MVQYSNSGREMGAGDHFKNRAKSTSSIRTPIFSKMYGVGCKKCGFLFSKIRSKKVVAKNPYFQKAPLIVNESMPVFTRIPLFFTDKGIRGDEKGTNLLLRELSKNKGLMRKKNEHFFTLLPY